MSNSDRSRPVSAKFSNTRSSARIRKYDATELRTIQDYIVRPILRTVPGVTDVNSFGGLVKQYQVIVNPDRLTSLHVTLATGLRGAGEEQFERERQLHRAPIGAIRRARARFGEETSATSRTSSSRRRSTRRFTCAMWPDVKIGAELRQGAVTANGEGEAVAGIVLMLKGASGRDVVNAVKEKLPAIQKALPKGVELVPFYDRTDLVKKAIHTVTKALTGRRGLRPHHPDRAPGRCAQRAHRHARSPAVCAFRLHHDEMVWG